VLLFKMLVLQRLYHLADEALEFQVQRQAVVHEVPWAEPRSFSENALIKEGVIPIECGKEPYQLAQKDTDARCTKKNGESIYGYKDHVNVDRDTQLITTWKYTPAQVHDSQALEAVLRSPEEGGAEIHVDSAYRSAEQEIRLIETGHVSRINEKG
jgi:IS5 family transposase